MMAKWYQWDGTDLILRLKVQPGGKRDEILGVQGEELKVRITAPPVEGKANKYLCKYLASICKVKKSHTQIVSGLTSRNKTVRIQLAEQQLPECFLKLPTESH